MDFIFQGFQSNLPLWSYLLMLVGTVLLSWWSYKEVQGIGSVSRYGLIALRSSVFFILILLLVNPILKLETPYFERPNILVMMDNSASTAVEKNSYRGKQSYRELLSRLDVSRTSSIDFKFFSVGNSVRPSSPDSLTFDDGQTHLAQAVQTIKAEQAESDAAILISDGIYTRGQNPVYETGDVHIPVFTVGLGDTTAPKDLVIRSVSTNSTGYRNTQQSVSVSVSSRGFKGQSFQVQLLDGNEIRSTKTVNATNANSSRELTFELTPEKEGLQQYRIHIPPLNAEWTPENNTQRFSVDVKDARQNILSLAFEIHPDVKLIRSLLLTDKNTRLIKRTWINGNRFLEGDLNIDADSLDLAVIHGYPDAGLPRETEQKLADLLGNTSLFVTSTPLFSPRRFEREIAELPIQVLGRWNYKKVTPTTRDKPVPHPILELPDISYEKLNELYAPLQNVAEASGGTILLNSNFRGNDSRKPFLAIQELGNRRHALLTAYGWFRLDQNSDSRIREFSHRLLQNIISWTSADPDNQLMEIKPVQTTFGGSEKVVIDAYLTNESGEIENDASINISLSSDSSANRFYSMKNTGGGRYRLDLGVLPEGLYHFEATAEKGDRQITARKGEFAVAGSNAELINTRRNSRLLKQLASRTGGTYSSFDSVDNLWNNLRGKGLLEQNEKLRTSYFYLYRHAGWFILVLLLLAGEWIYRKYLSLP